MIFVVSTAANIDEDYEIRKSQYLTGVGSVICHYKINPYIVECVKKTDYLSEHFVGQNTSTNKGVSEINNLKNFLSQLSCNDDDHIIKHTLRYELINSTLIDEIKLNQFEIYCKDSSDIYGGEKGHGIHIFLMSMTYRCWKEFFAYFNPSIDRDYPVERQFSSFAKNKQTKYMDHLGIRANPWNHKKIYEV